MALFLFYLFFYFIFIYVENVGTAKYFYQTPMTMTPMPVVYSKGKTENFETAVQSHTLNHDESLLYQQQQ